MARQRHCEERPGDRSNLYGGWLATGFSLEVKRLQELSLACLQKDAVIFPSEENAAWLSASLLASGQTMPARPPRHFLPGKPAARVCRRSPCHCEERPRDRSNLWVFDCFTHCTVIFLHRRDAVVDKQVMFAS